MEWCCSSELITCFIFVPYRSRPICQMVTTFVERPTKADVEDVTAGKTGGLLGGQFAQRSRAAMRLMDTLRACGASMDLDIPTISIIGNQSAGKSSVIESISAIALPRSSGTCTQCPTEVRLTQKLCDWTCVVSLRFERDASHVKIGNVREIPFGAPISDVKDVTERVQRAQLAILNHASEDHQKFLHQPLISLLEEGNAASFSENVVCVSIRTKSASISLSSTCRVSKVLSRDFTVSTTHVHLA